MTSETAPTLPAPTQTPDAPGAGITTLADYREAKAKGGDIGATPTPPAPAADETPDPEVEADPDLRTEIDAIEAPKADETPAEKAARTRRNKEAARKGYATRQKNRADRAEAETQSLRQELDTLRRQPPAGGTPPAAPPPAARTPVVDPTDPEPVWHPDESLRAFASKHPDHPDPYAGAMAEHARQVAAWDRRQEQKAASRAAQAETSRRNLTQAVTEFDRHAEPLRATHPDFNAKVDSLTLTPAMADVIFRAGELGPHVAYALASDPAEYQRIARLSRGEQYAELGALRATVKARVAAPATPPPSPVTAAPTPHVPVGAGASAATVRKASDVDSVEEYRANRAKYLAAS